MTDTKPAPRMAEILARLLGDTAEREPVFVVARHVRRRRLSCRWRVARADRCLACNWEAR